MKDQLRKLILWLPGLSILYLLRFHIGPLPTNVFEVLVYLTAIAAWFTYPQWRTVKLSPSSKGLWVLGIAVVIAAVLVSPTREALGIIKGWLVPAVLAYWMLRHALQSEKDYKAMLKAMVWQGVLVAVVAMLQRLHPVSTWWSNQWPDTAQYLFTGRAVSLFNSPNAAAMILVPSLIIMRYLHNKTTDYTPALLILLGLLATDSRGGLIAAIVGLLVYGLWQRKQTQFGVSLSLVSLLLFNPVVLTYLGSGDLNNADIRIHIWRKSWELALAHPVVGIGLGSFQTMFHQFTLHQPNFDEFITPYALHPHNVLLYVWLSFGLVGLVGFVYLLFRSLSSSVRLGTPHSLLGGALIIAMLVHGMVDTTIFKNDLIIWFVVALVLVSASQNSKLQDKNSK